MTKTSISVNIDSEVKKQAESILAELDISVSEAITMFYKQIILQHTIPFEMNLPACSLPDISQLTSEQLDAELEKGYCDILAGRTKPAEAVFASLRSR